jgi:hypothetical protein
MGSRDILVTTLTASAIPAIVAARLDVAHVLRD